MLEQICEIFQEAVHKHIIESDRQDLLGRRCRNFFANNPSLIRPIYINDLRWNFHLLKDVKDRIT